MKLQLFISYSDFDKDKVDLIDKELESHVLFTPLIIAAHREALKPLVEKVSEGIEKSTVIIPLLTTKSITTQWINQEIGYAFGILKPVKPIVEKGIIDNLKGFIHKQVDLPYSFSSNHDKEVENSDFLKVFRVLISDLEEEYGSTQKPPPEKSLFEQSLEKVDFLNNELDYQEKKKSFLNSPEAVVAARNEVLDLFNNVKEKIEKLRKKGLNFGVEEQTNPPSFVFKSEGYSCSIQWDLRWGNSLEDAKLFVSYWKGSVSIKPGSRYIPGREPKETHSYSYSFDRDKNLQYCWMLDSNKQIQATELIVDNAIQWLVGKITESKLKYK